MGGMARFRPVQNASRTSRRVWVRRTLGKGIASTYAIGYQLNERWWTLFFDRTDARAPEGAENWCVEAYNDTGRSWAQAYYYWPAERRWRHPLYAEWGDDYGRYPVAATVLVADR